MFTSVFETETSKPATAQKTDTIATTGMKGQGNTMFSHVGSSNGVQSAFDFSTISDSDSGSDLELQSGFKFGDSPFSNNKLTEDHNRKTITEFNLFKDTKTDKLCKEKQLLVLPSLTSVPFTFSFGGNKNNHVLGDISTVNNMLTEINSSITHNIATAYSVYNMGIDKASILWRVSNTVQFVSFSTYTETGSEYIFASENTVALLRFKYPTLEFTQIAYSEITDEQAFSVTQTYKKLMRNRLKFEIRDNKLKRKIESVVSNKNAKRQKTC